MTEKNGSLMLVNAVEKEETRIALVSGGRLEDYHVARSSRETLVGNIYKGRVQNVHGSLQAAFVDIGMERNAFLHVSEVIGKGEKPYRPPPRGRRRSPRPKRFVQNLLQVGQEVVVQIIRDAFGEKGPSVTMNISLPGRFLVLTPLSRNVGVSRKIQDRRKRAELRGLLKEFEPDGESDVGFIIRTAGSDTTPHDLKADCDYLKRLWKAVDNRAEAAGAPATLYQETEIVLRTVRDFFTRDIRHIVVDNEAVHQRLAEFFEAIMPRYRERIEYYGEATPLFHRYDIETQIEQLNQRQVPLESGGSIVIEPTEALTAIDVNSGRLVRESSPEDLALRTNQEAAREIMRQLRLRDTGGIIVVDFIDMKSTRHRNIIQDIVRKEASRDRSQMALLDMSRFCLMEIARQKVRPSVQLVSHEPCPACGGTGFVKNTESIVLEIVRELRSTLEQEEISVVEARVSTEVAGFLQNKEEEFREMEEKYNKRIHISPSRDLPSNRVEFTCYNRDGEKVFDIVQ